MAPLPVILKGTLLFETFVCYVYSPTASLSKCDLFVKLCSRWNVFNWHSTLCTILR